jgi:hypothetical protein
MKADLETLKEGELKPCPFCDGVLISSGEVLVDIGIVARGLAKQNVCLGCGACGPEALVSEDEAAGPVGDELADAAWNRRPSLPEGEAPSFDDWWPTDPVARAHANNSRDLALIEHGWQARASAVLPGGNEGAIQALTDEALDKLADQHWRFSLFYTGRNGQAFDHRAFARECERMTRAALGLPSPSQPGQD